ncbi:3a protein [Humulus japonicus latent virus]|uniref:Movement protein n=1 Tax=Humulus japonicus latent virus TaxID=269213 RepID=Q6JE40_9BROM|nr:3a protein [Humulus japonicus latent virus]AAS86440.1 3a protein [Humulus japonicus latent virus]
MASSGNNTTDTRPSTSFQVDHQALKELAKVVHDAKLESLMELETKCCYARIMKNSSDMQCLDFRSIQTRSFLSKIKLSLNKKEDIFVDHAIIYALYVPMVLPTTSALASVKLLNLATAESIDIEDDMNAARASLFITRWPRSIHKDQDGVHIVLRCNAPDLKPDTAIGVWYFLWDDSISFSKQRYEKVMPTLKFPIEETDATKIVKNKKMIQSLCNRHIKAGLQGSDVRPESLCVDSTKPYKPLTVMQGAGKDMPIKVVEEKDHKEVEVKTVPGEARA